MEEIEAEVTGVMPLNGFWGRISARHEEKSITIMGSTLDVAAHDTIKARGEWSMHPRYGMQFKATHVNPVRAKTPQGAIGWLAHRLPGVGRGRAAAMVEIFGLPGVWEVLEQRPEELSRVRGITDDAIADIAKAYQEHAATRKTIVALRDLGLTEAKARDSFAKWGTHAPDVIRENPYVMIEEIHGVGFKLADRVATGPLRLPKKSPARIRAGLAHALGEFARDGGHTYVPNGRLVAAAAGLLEVDRAHVVGELRYMKESGRIVGEPKRSQLPSLYEAERIIDSRIQQISQRMELDEALNFIDERSF